jgi:hypothetical protein
MLKGYLFLCMYGFFDFVRHEGIRIIVNYPRTGHEGLEGEQMYSSTVPSTSVLDRGG